MNLYICKLLRDFIVITGVNMGVMLFLGLYIVKRICSLKITGFLSEIPQGDIIILLATYLGANYLISHATISLINSVSIQ